jgi:UDP-N-acetylglucosamine--N-acetylmuramyl-(pentapeptide) pyrophosphoryl-undecaprenol N-acetylglucosamine transferase
MPRVLFGVSPIGLGHATRAMVLAEELRKKGADVKLFSGGVAAEFIRDAGVAVEDIVEDPVPHVRGLEMSRVALWYARSWWANRRTLPRTRKLAESYAPQLVVCDEEFSGLAVAEERGVKRVFVSDELELGFARTLVARKIEARVESWYKRLQASVDLLIVPDSGRNVGNRVFVGPIVRQVTQTREETRESYGLPPGPLVLFAMSGSGIGREVALALKGSSQAGELEGISLAITGNRGEKISGEGVYDLGVVRDNQNLVACSDLVVSTAGKSTIDEATAAGTPVIVIPIRHHSEQERNASALGYSSDDLPRLTGLVRDKIGRREAPREFRGEEMASQLILSLV